MTVESRERFAATVRSDPVDLGLACALLAVEADPGLDVEPTLRRLDALAEDARSELAAATSPGAAALTLQQRLGRSQGFAGQDSDYGDLRSSLLPSVLIRRRGLPILLAVVWLEVARRAGLQAHGVGLPGHFVVGVGPPGDAVLADPFAGGRPLGVDEADTRVRAVTGRGLLPEDLAPTPADALLLRVLTNIRAFAARSDRTLESAPTRLWAVELSLLLPRHPAALRRERGELLVRLGRALEGAAELESYAEAVAPADANAAEAAGREARMARAQLN